MCSLDNIETVHREKKFEKKKSGIPAKARKVASLSDINDFTLFLDSAFALQFALYPTS